MIVQDDSLVGPIMKPGDVVILAASPLFWPTTHKKSLISLLSAQKYKKLDFTSKSSFFKFAALASSVAGEITGLLNPCITCCCISDPDIRFQRFHFCEEDSKQGGEG